MERDEENLAIEDFGNELLGTEEVVSRDAVRKPQITRDDVISLCIQIEEFCPLFGCHVALTGGYLYKDGPRKDIDLLFYRIRQVSQIDRNNLIDKLEDDCGMIRVKTYGWLQKMIWKRKEIDLFFPEHVDSDYDEKSNY